MVHIGGQRPLLWHVMKYYAHYGHKDFILCLGYRGDCIKDYFLSYNEFMTNDFVMEKGGSQLELLKSDISDWRISFVDTGLYSNVGERLRRVRSYLAGEEMFLANYSDGLSDLPLDTYMDAFKASGKTAGFVSVKPPQSTHVVHTEDDGTVTEIEAIRDGSVWINGGYFILKNEIFDHMNPGEELVHEPFHRLIQKRQLYTYQYGGFWTCLDTFKEKQDLDEMWARGNRPWELWSSPATAVPAP
jgi:glucose-1-phosphate cytidylyltransferase